MAFNHEVIGKTFGPFEYGYSWKDAVLYALASGAQEDELDLVLESRGPMVLPTFSVIIVRDALMAALSELGGNLLTLVHGAQECILHQPLPARARLKTTCTISGLYDKGKGGLAIYETKTVDDEGEPVFDTVWQIFYRGEGGFGGERGPDAPSYDVPEDRAPDASIEMPTATTQALLYRLTGDQNPIHSDPEIAKKAGFPRPILHGLCTFGHAGRAAIKALTDGNPERLTGIHGRFSKPVFPGETIVTNLWRMADSEAYYQSKVKERDELVITLGRVTYRQ